MRDTVWKTVTQILLDETRWSDNFYRVDHSGALYQNILWCEWLTLLLNVSQKLSSHVDGIKSPLNYTATLPCKVRASADLWKLALLHCCNDQRHWRLWSEGVSLTRHMAVEQVICVITDSSHMQASVNMFADWGQPGRYGGMYVQSSIVVKQLFVDLLTFCVILVCVNRNQGKRKENFSLPCRLQRNLIPLIIW